MSMLSEQVNMLRMLAVKLRNVHARQGDDFVESCETLYWSMCAMHEAADTIEGLRNRLHESYGKVPEQAKRGNGSEREGYDAGFESGVNAIAATLGSDDVLKPCPWCGRDMDKRSEADKNNEGHAWYRDDSDYIQGLIRSNEFMKKKCATLGSGECEIEVRKSAWGGFTQHCGNCGADLDCDTRNKQNYCPNCGKAVKR